MHQLFVTSGSLSADLKTLHRRIYKAMIDMLVPSIASATRDMREVIRLCRLLWPKALEILRNDEGATVWKVCCLALAFGASDSL